MSMDIIPFTIEERKDTGLYNAKMGIWLFLASEIMLFGSLFSSYILLRAGSSNWPVGSTILNVPIGTFNTLVLIGSSVTVLLAWASLRLQNFNKFKIYLGTTILLAFIFLFVKSYEYGTKFMVSYDGSWPVLPWKVFGATGHGLLQWIMHSPIVVKVIAGLLAAWLVVKTGTSIFRNKKSCTGSIALIFAIAGILAIMLALFELGNRAAHHHYPPGHNNFMAIYFTLTGLHGLHVIGGIIVKSYFFFKGEKMWKAQPQRMINRVEVAGLYWHFVDLVWIFLFPVLYLL